SSSVRHVSFSLASYDDHRDLHSFPTRRSSDLGKHDPLTGDRRAGGQEEVIGDVAGNRLEQLAAQRLQPAVGRGHAAGAAFQATQDRKSTRLNSSHVKISYAVFCLKKKKNKHKR